MISDAPMSARSARQLLGLGPLASPGDIRRAFREAAKTAHPDRPGGDEERFRQIVSAYHRLQPSPRAADRIIQPPATRTAEPAVLTLSPLIALNGGSVDHTLPNGRRLRIRLPAGLRAGDTVRAGAFNLAVALAGTPEMLVRGDDLRLTVAVAPRILDQGGRVALDTPLGRRIVWITKPAGERKLVRLVGQGLPARGPHAQGHLFLRLAPAAGTVDTAARALLRRFAAAWAA